VRLAGATVPRVRTADPDRCSRLRDVDRRIDGEFAVVTLPEPHVWQIVIIDLAPA
jgi:hypothetical protein